MITELTTILTKYANTYLTTSKVKVKIALSQGWYENMKLQN